MFGSTMLDTALGLAFVFLLVSMFVTVVNEMIAALFLSRAKGLRKGIDSLLESRWARELYSHPLIEGLPMNAAGALSHARAMRWRGRGPSYIPSRAFANVLLDVVSRADPGLEEARHRLQRALDTAAGDPAAGDPAAGDPVSVVQHEIRLMILASSEQAGAHAGLLAALTTDLKRRLDSLATGLDASHARNDIQRFIDAMPARHLREVIKLFPGEKIRKTLLVLLDDAGNDGDKFKQNIEIWFNNAMDRVGGTYKRRSQWVIALLSLLAAVFLNVDTVLIVKYLGSNAGVREALVAQAQTRAGQPAADAAITAALQAQLKQLNLPIGWVRPGSADGPAPTDAEVANQQVLPGLAAQPERAAPTLANALAFHSLGWLLTALAATLGAPFWFDTLNRFISIRSAGRAPEDKPKPPRDVPNPLEPGQSPH